jgi:hypothetical protein
LLRAVNNHRSPRALHALGTEGFHLVFEQGEETGDERIGIGPAPRGADAPSRFGIPQDVEAHAREAGTAEGLGDHGDAESGLHERKGGCDFGDFLNGTGMEAVFGTEGEDVLMHGGRTFAGDEDERFVTAVAETERFRRTRRHARDEHQAVFDDREGFKFASDGKADEAEVDFLRAERLDLFGGGHIAQTEFDGGNALSQAHENTGNQFESVETEADAEASGLSAGSLPGAFEEVIGIADEETSATEELLTQRGESGAVASTCEEFPADLIFKAANLLREGRLAQVEEFGGATEMQLLGEGNERSDFANFHNCRLSPS